MRTVLATFLTAFILIASSCKNKPVPAGTSDQGTVTYQITYPDSLKYGLKSALLPKEIVLVFKGDKATFIASAGMGMIQMVNILDVKNRSAVSLLIDQLRGNVAYRPSPEEIQENENSVHYRFEDRPETKDIAGYRCRKVSVSEPAIRNRFDVYACDRIRFSYWNSPFVGQDHLMLEYTHTLHNLTMKLVASKVDLTTPVDTSLFEVKGSYKWMNEKEFIAYLSTF